MNKRQLLGGFALTAVLALSGCGQDKPAATADQAPAARQVAGAPDTVVQANARFCQMFGYGLPNIPDMPAVELFPSQADYDLFGRLATPLLSNAEPVDVEIRMRRSDGNVFWAQVVGYVVNPADPSQGTFWIVVDRSESHALADSLRLALHENTTLFNEAPLGMVVVRQHEMLRCNQQFESMLGASQGSLAGVLSSALHPDVESYCRFGLHIYKPLKAGMSVSHETQLRRCDGSLFWARLFMLTSAVLVSVYILKQKTLSRPAPSARR